MARFLLANWPIHSHLYPYLAISDALRCRGHEVAHYNGARFQPVVEREGYTFFPFRHVDEGIVDRNLLAADRNLSWSRPDKLMANLTSWMLDPIPDQVADLEAILDQWRPDVIVSDVVLLAPPLILHEKYNIPVAIVPFAGGCMIPGPDAPIWGFGLPPPDSLLTRWRSLTMESIISLAASRFRNRADEIRRRYQLAPLNKPVHAFLGDMPLYLARGAPEFDYDRRDLPSSVHYVGPLLWNTNRNQKPTDWLADLRRDQPVVHVTEGTMQSAPVLLRAAAAGLGGLPIQVVMTTGGNRDPEALGLAPIESNIRIESWVRHDELLPLTDVVVTVGGAGTVLASLAAGVPLVVVPGESDQLDSASRVADAGAGICLPRRKCSPQRLRSAIELILRTPSYRENARRLSAALARYGSGHRAAELLEALACRSTRN